MKIDLVLRSQSPMLLERMLTSAHKTANGQFGILVEEDHEKSIKLASTYNRLIAKSQADIVCVIHDDIEFLSKGWDRIACELFSEYKPDILGVVGSKRYNGGRVFDSGRSYGAGHYCGEIAEKPIVKIFSKRYRYQQVAVVDGMLMFISREFWKSNSFDETFDGLFFFDLDLCLRASRVGVTSNIFVKHSKPAGMFGQYPEGMKPIGEYWDKFHEKHDLHPMAVGDQRCACVSLEDFNRIGQNTAYEEFSSKYLVTA